LSIADNYNRACTVVVSSCEISGVLSRHLRWDDATFPPVSTEPWRSSAVARAARV